MGSITHTFLANVDKILTQHTMRSRTTQNDRERYKDYVIEPRVYHFWRHVTRLSVLQSIHDSRYWLHGMTAQERHEATGIIYGRRDYCN
jgi:hypothetical protein